MKKMYRSILGLLGAAVGLVIGAAARADVVTYTVDPARSSLTISGTYAGVPFQAQSGFANSLTVSYSGTIQADLNSTLDTLQITGGVIIAADGGAYAPFELPANYGIDTTTLDGFIALRDFGFSMSSPVINLPESFDSSLVSASTISGLLDHFQFNYVTLPGGTVTGGYATDPINSNLAFSNGSSSLSTSAGDATITIPISADLTVPANGNQLTLHYSGSVVGVASVPEPSLLTLLIGGLVCLVCRRQRAR